MKTLVIRAFVLGLVVTGAAATAHSKTTGHTVVASSFYPVPTCPPNDPHACGLADGN